MSLATLAGHSVSRALVQVPAWGLWWADVDLVEAELVSGRVALVLADVTLSGTVVSGGLANGRAAYRVVGGAGGWGATIAAESYLDDAGVRVAGVLGDAAAACGETIAGADSAARIGPHYARANALARDVLNELAPRNWYVDFNGVTQIGQRAETTYVGDGVRTRVDAGVGVIDLAIAGEIVALVPGVVVDGALPAVDVEYELTETRLTARVYAGRRPSRRLDAWGRLLDAFDPRRRYRGSYEFRVVSQSGDRVNLQPIRASSGLKDLARVPMRGPAGMRAQVTLGSSVVVSFVDCDPSRPFVYAFDAWDAPGWAPSRIDLSPLVHVGGVSAAAFVARADFVADELTALKDAISNAVPVPNDGGAALQAQILAALAAWPASVAAENTKVS